MKTYKEKPVYGMEDWQGAFEKDFKPGDYFDAEIHEYFLNVLPPRNWNSFYLQVGEPYSHEEDSEGKYRATYTTFVRVSGEGEEEVWEYRGHCFAGEEEENYKHFNA